MLKNSGSRNQLVQFYVFMETVEEDKTYFNVIGGRGINSQPTTSLMHKFMQKRIVSEENKMSVGKTMNKAMLKKMMTIQACKFEIKTTRLSQLNKTYH